MVYKKIIMVEISRERILDSFIKVDKVSFDNVSTKFEVVQKKNAIATLCIKDDKVILVSQYRVPTESIEIEVVAGHIESGHSIEETIRKEVYEEIGYEIKKIIDFGFFYTSPGFTTEKVYLSISYLGNKVSSGGGLAEENENINIIEYSISDFLNANFTDLKTRTLQLELLKIE